MVIGCKPGDHGPQPDALDLPEPAEAPADPRPARLVTIAPPPPVPGLRWDRETAGLFTGLVELGLADLPDVVPRVQGAPAAPGLDRPLTVQAPVYALTLSLAGTADALTFGLSLCDADQDCVEHSAVGTRDAPLDAVAQLLRVVGPALGGGDVAGASHWAEPLTLDPYAQLISGRGAATYYGLLPAPAVPGDKRRDPIARAVLIDPSNPLAGWMLGRLYADQGDPGAARRQLVRAQAARPECTALRAGEAALLNAEGKPDEAHAAWLAADTDPRGSTRFVLHQATALLGAEKPALAAARLDAVPVSWRASPGFAALRVQVATALGEWSRYDELLLQWQVDEPAVAEPVRRRIGLRVRDGRWQEALDLTPELARRVNDDEAARVRVGLLVTLGQFDAAATEAAALGDGSLAARIRLRGRLTAGQSPSTADIDAGASVRAELARGRSLLAAGDAKGALALSRKLDARSPWMPEVALLERAALAALGQSTAAADARLVQLGEPAPPLPG